MSEDDTEPPHDPKTPREKAKFIFEFLNALALMARQHPHELRLVLYFLEMAAYEAEAVANGKDDGDDDDEDG